MAESRIEKRRSRVEFAAFVDELAAGFAVYGERSHEGHSRRLRCIAAM